MPHTDPNQWQHLIRDLILIQFHTLTPTDHVSPISWQSNAVYSLISTCTHTHTHTLSANLHISTQHNTIWKHVYWIPQKPTMISGKFNLKAARTHQRGQPCHCSCPHQEYFENVLGSLAAAWHVWLRLQLMFRPYCIPCRPSSSYMMGFKTLLEEFSRHENC